jgi:acyl carrier protein
VSIEERLAILFQKVFKIERDEFSPHLQPEDLLLWDSLGHMNLVMDLEETFDVHFEADEITEMTSAVRIVELLKAKGVKD